MLFRSKVNAVSNASVEKNDYLGLRLGLQLKSHEVFSQHVIGTEFRIETFTRLILRLRAYYQEPLLSNVSLANTFS